MVKHKVGEKLIAQDFFPIEIYYAPEGKEFINAEMDRSAERKAIDAGGFGIEHKESFEKQWQDFQFMETWTESWYATHFHKPETYVLVRREYRLTKGSSK